MPILSVKALPQKDPSKISSALKKTCVAISKIYGCRPEQVWGTWEELNPGHFVEGNNEASMQPEGTHPPIAQLLCFEGKSDEQIEKILTVASKTLSDELDVGDNIFMTYREAKSGRVVAGNGIVRKKL